MSGNTDVIKEFLVKIGFKTDESALKNFKDGIRDVTKTVYKFALVVDAAAISVAVGVAKFASNLEALYFASQRTGVAAQNLKAFDRAAQSFGTSAGEAAESVEGLARFFRSNPAAGSYLNSFLGQIGESAYDTNGQLKDKVSLLTSLGKLMRHNTEVGQGYQNAQLGGIFGIDEKTILAIQNPEFLTKYQNELKYLKESGLDKAADGAHNFMDSLRKLEDQLYVFGIRVVDVLQKKLGWSLDSITDWMRTNGPWLAGQVSTFIGSFIDDFNKLLIWLKTHGPEIEDHITHIFSAVSAAYNLVAPAFEWIFRFLFKLDGWTAGWSTKIIVLLGLFYKIGGFKILQGVWKMSAAFFGLGKSLNALSKTESVLASLMPKLAKLVIWGSRLVGLPAAIFSGYKLGGWFDDAFPNNWLAKFGNAIGADLDDYRHPANDIIERLTNQGFSRSQAIGISANLRKESAYDENASVQDTDGKEHYGLAMWSPDRQAAFKAWSGQDIHNSNRQKQIEFIAYELRHDPAYRGAWALMQAHSADTAANANFNARTFSRNYERPANGDQEAEERGRMAMNYQMTTTINVNGDKDPHKTADLVARHIDRLNQQTTRLFAPSVQ